MASTACESDTDSSLPVSMLQGLADTISGKEELSICRMEFASIFGMVPPVALEAIPATMPKKINRKIQNKMIPAVITPRIEAKNILKNSFISDLLFVSVLYCF